MQFEKFKENMQIAATIELNTHASDMDVYFEILVYNVIFNKELNVMRFQKTMHL